MTQQYFAVTVQTQKTAIEAVEFALNEAGADGIELDLLGKRAAAEIVSVVGYFLAPPDREVFEQWLAVALLNQDLPPESIISVKVGEVENRDWLAEWKKHWKPTETAKFIVAPTWFELPENDGKIILRIEPGMAFGTGTHETTQLCLKAIEENYTPEMSFFDVGTGTGVLAIGAAKFQISNSEIHISNRILGCDTDVDSIGIAIENAEVNQVDENIEFYIGSITPETAVFDFVCANLTADVIVPLLPLLTQKFERMLVLSGILREQQDWVTAELNKAGISDFAVAAQGEWISIVVNR